MVPFTGTTLTPGTTGTIRRHQLTSYQCILLLGRRGHVEVHAWQCTRKMHGAADFKHPRVSVGSTAAGGRTEAQLDGEQTQARVELQHFRAQRLEDLGAALRRQLPRCQAAHAQGLDALAATVGSERAFPSVERGAIPSVERGGAT
jgi:hypothetical protein